MNTSLPTILSTTALTLWLPACNSIDSLLDRCESGDAAACTKAGNKLANDGDDGDEEVRRDGEVDASALGEKHDRIRSLYQQACDGGHEDGCLNLSATLSVVYGDKAGAMKVDRVACEAGMAMPCADLSADLILQGKDREAQEAMERAECIREGGPTSACPSL